MSKGEVGGYRGCRRRWKERKQDRAGKRGVGRLTTLSFENSKWDRGQSTLRVFESLRRRSGPWG